MSKSDLHNIVDIIDTYKYFIKDNHYIELMNNINNLYKQIPEKWYNNRLYYTLFYTIEYYIYCDEYEDDSTYINMIFDDKYEEDDNIYDFFYSDRFVNVFLNFYEYNYINNILNKNLSHEDIKFLDFIGLLNSIPDFDIQESNISNYSNILMKKKITSINSIIETKDINNDDYTIKIIYHIIDFDKTNTKNIAYIHIKSISIVNMVKMIKKFRYKFFKNIYDNNNNSIIFDNNHNELELNKNICFKKGVPYFVKENKYYKFIISNFIYI